MLYYIFYCIFRSMLFFVDVKNVLKYTILYVHCVDLPILIQHNWIFHFTIFCDLLWFFKTAIEGNLTSLESSGGDTDHFISRRLCSLPLIDEGMIHTFPGGSEQMAVLPWACSTGAPTLCYVLDSKWYDPVHISFRELVPPVLRPSATSWIRNGMTRCT
jgi:hypothetical protein